MFAALLTVLCLNLSFAQTNLVERVYEGQSKDANPVAARSEMMNQASSKISEQVIKEIIGEAKFIRNKQLIEAKIMKTSARYIPFSKPGDMKPLQPTGFSMKVVFKVSIDSLQSLLLENGLFYETDSTPVVLPGIRWVDKVNSKNYAWWVDGNNPQKAFLLKESKELEVQLKAAFLKNNFYLLKPQALRFHNFIPANLHAEVLRAEDWQSLAQKLNSQVWVDGEIVLSRSEERSEAYKINLKWTASQVLNGRVIAEVARQFETDVGNFEIVVDRKFKENVELASQDLSSQVLEAWQKGALGASLYRLTINGHMPLLQQEAFKEALKNKVREVKNVRERLISADALVFEVDSTLSPKELAAKMPKLELTGINIILVSADDTEAVYRAQKGK